MTGAPHLAFEMWESKNPDGRCRLTGMTGAPHRAFEMWESTNPGYRGVSYRQ